MQTLSAAPSTLLDLIIAEDGLADLDNLNPQQKNNLFRKLGAVQQRLSATYKTKGTVTKTLARMLGVGESTISLWVALYKEHGFRGLIDGRKATSSNRAALPDVTRQWIKSLVINCTRDEAFAEARRGVLDQWNLWRRTGDPVHAIPGFVLPPPDCGRGEPAGFSLETFRRCRPGRYAKTLAAQGPIAAYRLLPSILSTCVGTEYLEYVFFDDEKPDVNVRIQDPGKPVVVPLCFHALDRLTRYPFRPHVRLRWYDADSKTHKHLTRKEFVFYVIWLLCTEGYRADHRGTCLIQEHGTAKVWANQSLRTPDGHHSFEDALRSITARDNLPGVRLDASGIFRSAAFGEMIYGPQPTGNPRFKAPIESSFRLWRIYSQHLRGQTGRNIEMAPEETYGLTKYEEKLCRDVATLPPEFQQNIISNYLTPAEFGVAVEIIRQALAGRTDHAFEGWGENGFHELVWRWAEDSPDTWRTREELARLATEAPHIHEHALAQQRRDPRLTRVMQWSPEVARENRRRDPVIRKLPFSAAIHLVPTAWLKPAAFNARHFIEISDELLPGMDLQYLPELTTPTGRTEYLHHGDHVLVLLNPLMPDTLLACDQSHTFIGTLTRNVPLGRDSDQIEALMRQRSRIKTALGAPARRAMQETADRREAVRMLNDDLLARVAAPAAEIVSKPERAPRVDPLAASLSPSAPPETEEDPFA